MVRATEVCNVDGNFPLWLSEYPALPASVLSLGTGLVTQRQPAVRADKLPRHGAEAGETEGRAVMVGTKGHRLLSDNRKLHNSSGSDQTAVS